MTDIFIAKLNNALESEDKKKRKKALEELSKLFHNNNQLMEIPEKVEQVFKHILRCFNDKSEACRELAINIVIHIVCTLQQQDSEQYVVYIIPTLLQRLGSQEIIEPSEEIRLLLISLLHNIVTKCNTQLLPSYLSDIVQILVKTIVDPFPKVKKESCECAADISEIIPMDFYTYSESIVRPILLNVTHQHYRVRVSAIMAIGKVVRYGNNKSVDVVIGPLAERLFDQTPMVRQAIARIIGMWLIELPDRYSYFYRLVPLILTSMTDDIPEVKDEALSLWNEAGKLYMQENENDLKDEMDFLIEEPDHYPITEIRPNLGCRTLVNRNLSKIIPAVVQELGDWLVDIRIKSSQLLYSLLLNAESNITHHLEKILIGMYRATSDDDVIVVTNIERAAELIGYFVPPDIYCKLVLPTMEDSATSGQLRIFASILKGSNRATLKEKLSEVGQFLNCPEICQSKEIVYQSNLLRCCSSIITVCEEDCTLISSDLFMVLVSVLGLSAGENITKKALGLLLLLQSYERCSSIYELFKKFVEPTLVHYETSAISWTSYSAEKYIFEAILKHSGPAVGLHLEKIGKILAVSLRPEKDPEMKLKMFVILSTVVFGKEEVLKGAPNLQDFLIILVKDVIVPNLVWQAGRTAEAIRTAAISCLSVALKHSPDSKSRFIDPVILEPIIGSLVPLLLTLIEDSSRKTRLFTCRTIYQLVILARDSALYKTELLHQLYPVVLKRLDDVNEDVRLSAVETLVKLFKPLPFDFDIRVSGAILDALFSTMLIHLDDPDPSFQNIMLGALKEVGEIQPLILLEKVNKSVYKFRNVGGCSTLAEYIKNLPVNTSLTMDGSGDASIVI